MRYVIVPLVGFSNGIIVGSGIVALISVLQIIPRIAQLTKTYDNVKLYEDIIVMGAVVASITSLTGIGINLGRVSVVIVGFSMGMFVGLLASALAEVLNVMPVLIRRFKLNGYITFIVYSLIFGKVIGSFLNWFIDF